MQRIDTTVATGSPIKAQREIPSTTAAGLATGRRGPGEEDAVPQRRQEAEFSCTDTGPPATRQEVMQRLVT